MFHKSMTGRGEPNGPATLKDYLDRKYPEEMFQSNSRVKKLTFEEWYLNTIGVTLEEARRRGVYSIDLMKACWKAAQENK